MRYALPILLLLAAAWYFTTGIRVGLVTFTPATMINANGKSKYKIRAFETKQVVGVQGTCTVKSGKATVTLYRPDGTPVAAQDCLPGGPWSLSMQGQGSAGMYQATINYRNFNGKIELNDVSAGN